MNSSKRFAAVGLLIVIAVLLWLWVRESKARPTTLPASSKPEHAIDDVVAPETAAARTASPVPVAAPPAPVAGTIVLVHGRCVDRDGLAIAGADVAILSFTWWKPDAEKFSSVHVQSGLDSPLLSRTQSGEAGRFTLTVPFDEVLPPKTLVDAFVQARTARQCSARARNGSRESFELDVGDLVLDPSTRIGGFVRDTAGRPCEGVPLYVSRLPDGNFVDEARSKSDGSFVIENAPAAPCKLVAWADDLREGSLDLDLSDGVPRLDLLVVLPELEGTDSISGIVVDPEDHPVAKAQLIKRTTAGPEPRLSLSSFCDDRGRFRIDGRPDSVFELTAGDREGRWCAVRKSDIRSGTHGIVIKLDGSRTFVLRVRSSTGEPIEAFGYERGEGAFWLPVRVPVARHPGGEVKVASDLEPFSLKVLAPGWSECNLGKLEPATMPEVVEAVLERACTVRGVVRSGGVGTRALVKIAESKLTNRKGDSRFEAPSPDGRTDKEGHFELTVDGSGTIRLQAQLNPAVSPISESIAIGPGAVVEGIVLELAAGGSVAGQVVRHDGTLAAGFRVSAIRDGKTVQSASTDPKGAYRLSGLSEGSYVLSVDLPRGIALAAGRTGQPSGSPRWSCEIVNGAETQLDLHLLETARLRVVLDLPEPPQTTWMLSVLAGTGGDGGTSVEDRSTKGRETLDFEFADPVTVHVDLECQLSSWPMLSMKQLPIDRGSREIPITLRAGRIEGTLAAPFAADEIVTLKWQGASLSGTAEARPERDGRFVFGCAPEGSCSVARAFAPEPGRVVPAKPGVARTVVVRAGDTVRVDGL